MQLGLHTGIDRKIAQNKVMIFSRTRDPNSILTKNFLKRKYVKFGVQDLNLEANGKAIQKALERKTGQKKIPYIFCSGKFIGDHVKLKAANKNGDFDELLCKQYPKVQE